MKKSTILTQLGIIIGIVLFINIIGSRLFFRLDFTEDKRYTLSGSTKDILKELEEDITVTAYFSENLPQDLLRAKSDFLEQLVEYRTRSGNKIHYEFINPTKDEETERKALQSGIMQLQVNVREKDEVKVQKAYMGAVVEMGEKKDVLPIIQPGAAMEYSLTASIKKLSVENKLRIAFLQGHGEPSLKASRQVVEALAVLYNVEPVEFGDSESKIPEDVKTIAIINPTDTFQNHQLQELMTFIANGGRLFVALNRVEGDLSVGQLKKGNNTRLEMLLNEYGISIEENFVIDASCGAVTVQQRQGFFAFNTQVPFPYFPLINNFPDHPITSGLEAVFLPFASRIVSSPDSIHEITPILISSKKAAVVNPPQTVDVNKQWTENDYNLNAVVMGVAVISNKGKPNESRIVTISNGSFAVNGEGRQAQQKINEDNVNLAVNAIDWLSDDTGLIELRTKGITSRPIEDIEETKKAMIKYANVLIPILLILLYGVYRYQRNRQKRSKWIEGNEV